MLLSYSSLRNEDVFMFTDFSCSLAKDVLERKDLFKIIWPKKAMSSFTIDSYQVSVKENEILFCTPLNIFELPENTDELVALVFNKEFFCIHTHDQQVSCNGFLFFGTSHPQIISLDAHQINQYGSMFDMFKEDLSNKDHLQGELLRSLLIRLLIYSMRIAKQGLPEPDITNTQLNIVKEYNLLVEKHFRQYHHVKDYANLLFKSPKTLANLFPKYSDESPLMVINNRILLEAKRLLLNSDLPTNEIAEQLGYKDQSHFSKFFKKHVGVSPSVFRKEKLEMVA